MCLLREYTLVHEGVWCMEGVTRVKSFSTDIVSGSTAGRWDQHLRDRTRRRLRTSETVDSVGSVYSVDSQNESAFTGERRSLWGWSHDLRRSRHMAGVTWYQVACPMTDMDNY